jgi:hypothetical protein
MSVPPRRPWLAPAIALGFGLGLIIVSGCDQPTGTTRKLKAKPAEVADEAPAQPKPAPVGPREILGKRDQDIRDVEKEKKAGGVVTPPRITAKDPIRLQGNAYVTAVGQISIGHIKHALDLYQAENGEFPKTYEEFMEKIIKANNIALPKLPFYQEYAYDAPSHSLVVMEYPERKKAAGYPE